MQHGPDGGQGEGSPSFFWGLISIESRVQSGVGRVIGWVSLWRGRLDFWGRAGSLDPYERDYCFCYWPEGGGREMLYEEACGRFLHTLV